ncbi:MAG TPA: bifunctional hydroxymethylpyrimidine kinase/phosphomethylpyrimidine kinase [Dissulfurispiraceae bacterium]|nr:bifunctional hydroxymethylpyrimidine kinase/phosphomethylpyrimidine kinase [Dissulfurispiraceae bacterium]
MKIALTIAGSDPTGGAGLQADLKVFAHLGVYGISAVAALTAQNTVTVTDVFPVRESHLDAQMSALLNDIRPDAIKTGMLYSAGAIRTVAKFIRGYDLQNLVIDPVTVSSTGVSLLEQGALDVMRDELFPLAKVITPNIYEASALSGIPVESEDDMTGAAEVLSRTGCQTVIITGGHLRHDTVDLLFDGKTFRTFRGRKTPGEYHGTGCAFSAAITAFLAKGSTVSDAAERAKEFVDGAIAHAVALGRGMRLLNV